MLFSKARVRINASFISSKAPQAGTSSSCAPLIARMRALEAGRYLIRAANDGISGIIGPHGEVVARAPEFRPEVLRGTVTPLGGLTPYARVGNWLLVSLAGAAGELEAAPAPAAGRLTSRLRPEHPALAIPAARSAPRR